MVIIKISEAPTFSAKQSRGSHLKRSDDSLEKYQSEGIFISKMYQTMHKDTIGN